MFRIGSLLAMLLISHGVQAQEQDPPGGRASKLADAYLLYGVFFQRESFMDLSDWQAMLPGSALLHHADIASDEPGSHGRSSRHGAGTLHFGVGLDLRRTENAGSVHTKQLRIGVLHSANNSNQGLWRRSMTGPYDTLVSQLTGEMYPVDTTWTERYSAYHEFTRLGVDLAIVLLNENTSLWSWQVGFGTLLGLTLNEEARVYRSVERRIDRFSYGTAFHGTVDRSERIGSEVFRNGPSLWAGTYVVLGTSCRLGRTHPFWSSLKLHYEARPTLLFSNFNGDVIRSMRAGGQHLLGLRLDLR
jgi:hypothetical protein